MKRNELINKYNGTLEGIIVILDVHTSGRKNKFPIKHYLNYIMRILFYGEHWNTFSCLDCDRSTIRKKFYKWESLNVFYKAHQMMLQKYTANRVFKRLFIDSTAIQNKNCSNKNVTYCLPKLKGKKQIKSSIICDSNGVILSHIITNPKQSDNKQIKPLIKQLNVNLKVKPTLVGDMGYLNKNKTFYVKGKRLVLLTPKRKNQRRQIRNIKTKKLLNERYKVELAFCHLKRTYKRTDTIEDRHLSRYNTFLIMALTCQIIRIHNK